MALTTSPLKTWLGESAKQIEVVAQRRDADAALLGRALAVVRQFIADRGLILYGGQAIDYAMRLRGEKLYPDHQTPDFDFFSSDNVKDAYDLAEILGAAGFRDVKAIVAIHVQTMRVGVESVFVADISYAPPNVFKAVPTVKYGDIKIVHPDYQRTDMHLAFCFPFNDPPREDVFHRFAKDLTRFNTLARLYPITSGKTLGKIVDGGGSPGGKTTAGKSPPVDLDRVAVHGFAAYGLLRGALDELLGSAGAPPSQLPRVAVDVVEQKTDGGKRVATIGVDFPAKAGRELRRLVLATPWPDEVVAGLRGGGSEVSQYAPYMDTRPEMTLVEGPEKGTAPRAVEVYSTRDRLLAVSVLKAAGGARVTVVSPQYLLLFFLHGALASGAPARALCVEYYRATLAVLAAADAAIARLREKEKDPDAYAKFLDSSPFGLTVRTLGERNFNASYLIRRATTERGLKVDGPGAKVAPTNYYLDRAKKRPPDFDYDANPAYVRGGQKL